MMRQTITICIFLVLGACSPSTPSAPEPLVIGGTSREENCAEAWSALSPEQAAGITQSDFTTACVADSNVLQCADGFILHTSAGMRLCEGHGGVARRFGFVDG